MNDITYEEMQGNREDAAFDEISTADRDRRKRQLDLRMELKRLKRRESELYDSEEYISRELRFNFDAQQRIELELKELESTEGM